MNTVTKCNWKPFRTRNIELNIPGHLNPAASELHNRIFQFISVFMQDFLLEYLLLSFCTCQVGAVSLMIHRERREMVEFGAAEILGLFSPFQKSLSSLLQNQILSVPTWRWQEVGGSELGNGLPCLGIFRIQDGKYEFLIFYLNNPFIKMDFGMRMCLSRGERPRAQ